MKKILTISIIMLFCFATIGYANNTDVDNLVQNWIQVGQGINLNFGNGGERLQNLPNIPGTSNPGTPTFVPGQMPGQHPNDPSKSYYQFLGARLVVKKDESGAMKQVWDFTSARPYFDSFSLQPYIKASKKKGAKFSVIPTWPKELELGSLPATMALPASETVYKKFDLEHVAIFPVEGENSKSDPLGLLAEAHEKARLAGFHLILIEQGGYSVNKNGSKGFSFIIGGTGVPSATSGVAVGIGPYVNTVYASTPIIPWYRFEVVADREKLEAKKAKLRIVPEKKYSVIFGKKVYESGEEGTVETEKKYVPVSPSEIIPLPLKKEQEKALSIPETPKKEESKPVPKEEPKPAPVPVPEVKKPEPAPALKTLPEMDELEKRAEKAAKEIQETHEKALKTVEDLEEKAKSSAEQLKKLEKITAGAPVIKRVKIPQLTILFELNKAVILPSEFPKIMEFAKWLNKNPDVAVQFEGHASYEGSRDYNVKLGYYRALAVQKVFAEYGVSSKQIQFVSLGKDKPTGGPDISKDRRVILRLIGEASGK